MAGSADSSPMSHCQRRSVGTTIEPRGPALGDDAPVVRFLQKLLLDAIGWRGMFLIGALPLVTILALIWLYVERQPQDREVRLGGRVGGVAVREVEDRLESAMGEDGTEARVQRTGHFLDGGEPPSWSHRLVVQVSRWDRLKDHLGVLNGFARVAELAFEYRELREGTAMLEACQTLTDEGKSFLALAGSAPEDVRRLWYPLGYNIRPKRLQSIAREAVDRYNELMMNYSDETADEATQLQDTIDSQNLWDLESQVEVAMEALG